MSLILNPITKGRSFLGLSKFYFYSTPAILWGKAYRESDESFVASQSPVSCKDYVVDTYFKDVTSSYTENATLKTKKYEPCFYIVADCEKTYNLVIEKVKLMVNAYERKHGFKETVIHKVTGWKTEGEQYQHLMLVFEYDPQWMINSTTMSMYLSIVRSSIFSTEKEHFDTVNFSLCNGCNEYNYYTTLHPKGMHLIHFLYNNPRIMLVDTTKFGYQKSGFKDYDGHGCSGLFYIIKNIQLQERYTYNIYRRLHRHQNDNYFYNVIHSWITGYEFLEFYMEPNYIEKGLVKKNSYRDITPIINMDNIDLLLEHLLKGNTIDYVKPVQSVQQKVVRKRVSKKTTKPAQTGGVLLGTL